MGCRLEIYCSQLDANIFIELAAALGIEARVIGRVEAGNGKKSLELHSKEGVIHY
jgi:phosphoribosylformylglycinamidine cyclo-ligase